MLGGWEAQLQSRGFIRSQRFGFDVWGFGDCIFGFRWFFHSMKGSVAADWGLRLMFRPFGYHKLTFPLV